MSSGSDVRTAPPKLSGWRHLLAAIGWSLSGLKRLLGEAAFRHELAGGTALLAVLAIVGVPLDTLALQVVLLCILAAFEAVNTAIELVVDRVSPEFSVFAAQAKDLGSLAVFILILANMAWGAAALWSLLPA